MLVRLCRYHNLLKERRRSRTVQPNLRVAAVPQFHESSTGDPAAAGTDEGVFVGPPSMERLSARQLEALQPADEEQALAFAVERSLARERPDVSDLNAEKATKRAMEVCSGRSCCRMHAHVLRKHAAVPAIDAASSAMDARRALGRPR